MTNRSELKGTSDMQLFDEKQNDLHRIEILSKELAEPEHPHTFYEETKNEIELLNKRIKQIDRIFESREWIKDLHRVMNELRYLTRRKLSEKASKNGLIVRIINTLLAQLSTGEIKRIIDKWQEKLEAKDRKQRKRKKPKIKNIPQATPESIEYWRKKWGISDESLEEKKEAI